MNKSPVSLVFLGSGPVAAQSLQLLADDSSFVIEAVITKPVPPHHKHDAPVISAAKQLGLPFLTAANKTELDDLVIQATFDSTVAVLIDFGIIVSQAVIDKFPRGIINSHFSLLPEWRGADPITFSILSGQPFTGVSLMQIDTGMDTGPLLASRQLNIEDDDTGDSLTHKLIQLSHEMLREFLPKYLKVSSPKLLLKPQPQSDKVTYSRKLNKDDGIVDWNESAAVIERKIRAFQPWPRCKVDFFGRRVVLLKAHVESQLLDDTKKLSVQCGDGQFLVIDLLIAPSGKRMDGEAFLRGYSG